MKKDNRLTDSFLKQLYKCKDITLLFGLGKILKVPPVLPADAGDTVDGNTEAEGGVVKDFDQFIKELILAFEKQPRGRRREIVKIFKSANAEVRAHGSYDINDTPVVSTKLKSLEEETQNGSKSEDTKESDTDETVCKM